MNVVTVGALTRLAPLFALLGHLLRYPANGMDHLVVRLRVVQLRLKQQRLRVTFLSGRHVSLGAEGRSS